MQPIRTPLKTELGLPAGAVVLAATSRNGKELHAANAAVPARKERLVMDSALNVVFIGEMVIRAHEGATRDLVDWRELSAEKP